MSGQRGVDPPAPPDPVTHRKRPEGLGLGEGCQGLRLRSQAATSDRQPDPRGRDPVGTRSPPHPSSLQAAPAPSTRALLLPLSTAGEKGSSPSPPTARTAPGDWTSSPDCRFPALKPDSSYLPRRRGTVSTESLAPTHAPTGAPAPNSRRRTAPAQARSGPSGPLPVVLCDLGAQLRALPDRSRWRAAEGCARGRGGLRCSRRPAESVKC